MRRDELELCLRNEPLFKTGLPENFASLIMEKMGSEMGPQEFLTAVRGKPTNSDDTLKLLRDALSAQVGRYVWVGACACACACACAYTS